MELRIGMKRNTFLDKKYFSGWNYQFEIKNWENDKFIKNKSLIKDLWKAWK
jgi:hypothetical protein